ncbi:hypothetical protein [Ascidiimonas aurantiaca]|uniref:hypothetical protein n=1 Tax=Ascidiimonas aurantiaca TaxID=1685432 RepID=UPI0030EE97E2
MRKRLLNLYLIFLGTLIFTGCNDGLTKKGTEATNETNKMLELTEKENVNTQIVKEDTLDVLALYLDKLYSYRQLEGIRLNYNNDSIIKGRDKHHFEYTDNWFSINVSEGGITYTGVYELNQDDTLLHYASILPEIEVEGGTFVNYENEPWFEYYYKNNQLSQVKYNDPKDLKAVNPLENLDKSQSIVVGDSIKELLDKYFYLDSSKVNFNGAWKYPKNSESYSFTIEIRQIGSFVSGSYCSYTPSKYDCGNIEQGGKACDINGYVYSDTLYLNFFSCYAGRSGQAKLYFSNDTLNWNTTYQVEESLVPEKINLEIK